MHFVVIPALTAVDSILSAQGNNALPSHYALSLGFVICLGKSQSIVRMSFRRLAIAMQQVGTGCAYGTTIVNWCVSNGENCSSLFCSPSVLPEGRLSITPIAPSSAECIDNKTTDFLKLGSWQAWLSYE